MKSKNDIRQRNPRGYKINEHYQKIRNVLAAVLVLNWLVAFAKIFYGLYIHSASITADGFHSLSDGVSNIVGLVGIAFASQPKDKDHPYGHKKYETLFSLGIGAFLFFVCYELIEKAIERLYHPVFPQIDSMSFGVMLVTLAVNLIVMTYEYGQGKKLKSDILVSDSVHTKADIFTTLSVIITLVVVKMGYQQLDAIASIFVALFIAYSGFEILRRNSRVLTDTVVIVHTKLIRDIVLSVSGVEGCHKIRSRGRSDDIYIDLHTQVSPGMTMGSAHQISHDIENALKKTIPGVTEVIVHMEPNEKSADQDK